MVFLLVYKIYRLYFFCRISLTYTRRCQVAGITQVSIGIIIILRHSTHHAAFLLPLFSLYLKMTI